MEQEAKTSKTKTYRSAKSTFNIKSPRGGFIQFVGGTFTTDDEKIIEHLDRIVKEEPHRQIRALGEGEALPPGHDLALRERQLLEWQKAQQNRNPEDSKSEDDSKLNAASTKDIKPVQGAGVRFNPADANSALALLKAKAAEAANKQTTPEVK